MTTTQAIIEQTLQIAVRAWSGQTDPAAGISAPTAQATVMAASRVLAAASDDPQQNANDRERWRLRARQLRDIPASICH